MPVPTPCEVRLELKGGVPFQVHVSFDGSATIEHAQDVFAEIDSKCKGKLIELWADTSGLTAYRTEFRTAWMSWIKSRRDQKLFAHVHVLVTSSLVSMGVQLAAAFLGGGVTSYSLRTEFDGKRRETQKVAAAAA